MTATQVRLRSRTTTKAVRDLSLRDYEKCLELTFCGMARAGKKGRYDPSWGSMHGKLEGARAGRIEAWATTLRDEDGEMVGWALTFPQFYFPQSMSTYFFVHPKMRRRGIGTRLYRSVRRRFGVVEVHPWDTRSRGFFRSVEGR